MPTWMISILLVLVGFLRAIAPQNTRVGMPLLLEVPRLGRYRGRGFSDVLQVRVTPQEAAVLPFALLFNNSRLSCDWTSNR